MGISIGALEEGTLCLLVHNSERAPGLALRLNPKFFTTRVNQKICETAIDYISRYRTAPGLQLEYLLESEFKRGEEGKLLAQTVTILAEQASQVQPDFILEQLDRFLDIQRMTAALTDGLEALQSGDLELAQDAVYKSTSRTSTRGTPGIWLSDPSAMLSSLDESRNEYFSCGIPTLDAMGIQLERKTLSFLIGSAKFGKSMWLMDVAKAAIQFGHPVVYITNELREETVARRMLQSIFALTKTEAQEIRTSYFEQDREGNTSIQFRNIRRDSVITRRKEIFDRLASMTAPPVLIKEFPTGELSTGQLDLYLDSLEKEKGMVPAITIVDMADLMKLDAAALRIDTGRLFRDLRGIAMRRNTAMVTVTQGNRMSSGAKVVDVNMVAEDWSKIGTADLVLTGSRTAQEKKLGLARILVAASRNTSDRIMVLIAQAYDICQFCLGSTFMAGNVAQEVERLSEDAPQDEGQPPVRAITVG